jgi:hypothetical protein
MSNKTQPNTEIIGDDKTKLIYLFKNCLNILRDNEGLTGETALRNMSYLFILKLIEEHLDNVIDIDNYDYNFEHINDDVVDEYKKKNIKNC